MGRREVRAGADLGLELGWFVKAGFSVTHALTQPAQTAADLAGLGNDLGRLTPGRLAYMVGFTANGKQAETLAGLPVFVGPACIEC